MKEILTKIKLQIRGGQANPAPPVGPALGQAGLNIQEFCTKFNDASKDKMGDLIPVEITVFKDRSYDFIMKSPPASELLKQAAKVKKGSGKAITDKVGSVTRDQLREIAKVKMADLNTNDVEMGANIIEGTAKQMGIEIK